MESLIPYVHVLLRLFVYVMQRYQSGDKFSKREKVELLNGLSKLCTQFFSTYISDVELGQTRMEISARGDVCVPEQPRLEDKVTVPEVLQDAQVRSTVPDVPSSLLKACSTPWHGTVEKHSDSVKVARRRSQQDQRETRQKGFFLRRS
jgi:hypothetical protein